MLDHAARSNRQVSAGCVSGRFQPLHNDHLELMMEVLRRHEILIVAITNPDADTRAEHVSNPERHRPSSNPFSYFERMRFVEAALSGVPHSRFYIVPFPIHSATAVASYVPKYVTQFVRAYSDWERAKSLLLNSYGYKVESMSAGSAQPIRSTEIRRAIAEGRPWSHLVPLGVAPLIDDALAVSSLSERAS